MVHTNPHNPADNKLCSICHTAEPPMLNRDPVTTCTRCHPGNVGNHPVTRHPMGLATSKNIPAYLPLTDERQMVCHTCHDPHRKTGNPRMLRVEYFRLCISCHKGY